MTRLMPRRLLIQMSRWPAPGRCKRRLAAGLGCSPAALVQQRLQWHSQAALKQACHQLGASRWLALAGAGPRAGRRLQAGSVVQQGGGGLGLRLQRMCVRAFRAGFEQVVLVGSDLPELASADLLQAFAALQHKPLVLGPAADGGYWLVGLSQLQPRLFAGIDWGSDQVLRQTLAVAEALSLPAALLALRHDLDRPTDLRRWR
ncbi:MAG: TIGR04282 family arsenosugar biosynthesis glycosyltransferase [Cyanobacteriota bacterium]|nr:TIGR04282 family arsenosugar biosynthesis glycosyltransferase [Cyanobacteriota bacterium]